MSGEEIVVAAMAVGWIIATVRGVRRMVAQEATDAEERHG